MTTGAERRLRPIMCAPGLPEAPDTTENRMGAYMEPMIQMTPDI